ncbi:ferredoxin-thioredoxin reductase, variable chain-like [Bidens hawaiensis]|uniref:ferredoxin-thioredoxin reductase, variable chain-like n=1 Tax=Bidens hawaiensis TaxID=980011 RepID=UPI00404994B5
MSLPATLAAATPPFTTTTNRPIPPLTYSHNLTIPLKTFTTTRSTRTPATTPAAVVDNPSTAEEEVEQIQPKVGARVRVTAPLKVYHVAKVPEVELYGKEGKLKEYVAVWKGKQISANLPYKIEFLERFEERGEAPVKFFAHLKDDEFEYID